MNEDKLNNVGIQGQPSAPILVQTPAPMPGPIPAPMPEQAPAPMPGPIPAPMPEQAPAPMPGPIPAPMTEQAPAPMPEQVSQQQVDANSMAAVSNLNKDEAMEEALSHTNQYSPFEAPKQEVNQEVKKTSNKGAYILIGAILVIMLLFIVFLPQISKIFGW